MIQMRFRVFHAVDDAESCRRYMAGHVKVLKDYGIENVTSNNNAWRHNPSIYGILAESMDGEEIYGGIRVQIANDFQLLPVEEAIGEMDPKIYDLVSRYKNDGGIGELCGLWNAKMVQKCGVSLFLTRAGISIVNQLQFQTLVGICGDFTLDMFTRVGFVPDTTLGDKGTFPYPKKDLLARVLGIMNAATLETAYQEDKISMMDLRNNPVQSRTETGPRGPIDVDYNLIVPINCLPNETLQEVNR